MKIGLNSVRIGAMVAGLLAASGTAVAGPDDPIILQWFEQQHDEMEHKMPDFFKSGYGAAWLPPMSKASSTGSAGYDLFNRFDLGSPSSETAYGTEQGFRALIDEFHRANGLVYLDTIMNHNSTRQTGASFQAAGGYPGFWMDPATPPINKTPTGPWGDFHAGNGSGYLQSENPNGANYNLFDGDLLALIDIDQATNNMFIRHPVATDPSNLPPGTAYNQIDPNNARFYPDTNLGPTTFWNPGTSRNPGAVQYTLYPFNAANPLTGDAVIENATGLILRWTQWMVEDFGVDGFRLDAAKHIPDWFWDNLWDNMVHLRRTTPDGRLVTARSFVESVEGNFFTMNNYVRKDSFANRDALDLNGAGKLRDVLNAAGFGSWDTALFSASDGHIDNADDGFNNGSLGFFHLFSHDNGSVGNGGSQPGLPSARQQGFPQNAYLLLRPGQTIVYHNARGISRPGGFWPREGNPVALGWDPLAGADDDTITTLVKLHNEYGRGLFIPLNGTDPVNQSYDDVIVYTRRSANSNRDSLLVGVNDRYDAGVETRNVLTTFPPGTRLHELTGNAADPVIDPTNAIPDVIVVPANQRVTIVIPNNKTGSTEHGKGYVVYGEALPDATLTLTNVSGTIAGEPTNAPPYLRRITDVPVIVADTFDIQIITSQADALDPNTDTKAMFRLNAGYVDHNNSGGVDYTFAHPINPGYEDFVTVNQPLFGGAGVNGVYIQTIDAMQLQEGMNYLSVLIYRNTAAFDNPLFREIREVIYIDRQCPQFELVGGSQTVTDAINTLQITALDRTTDRVHVHLNLPIGQDPIASSNIFNLATQNDRFEFSRIVTLQPGDNRITIVSFEESGRACFTDYTLTFGAGACSEADITTQGAGVGDPGFGVPDGLITAADINFFVNAWVTGDVGIADVTTQGAGVGDPGFGVPDGQITASDINYFVNLWVAGCP